MPAPSEEIAVRFYWGSPENGRAVSPARSETAIRVSPARDAPIAVQIQGEHSLDVLPARDISEGGIGIHVPHGFHGVNLDQEVALVITLPETRSFRALGRIRHRTRDPHGAQHFGLEFTEISKRCQKLICDYVHRRLDTVCGRSNLIRL